ncbi:MAG: hypothetical protein NTZ65_01010 [Candidatus Berkelbacteria bacterium]|nr:hypothetical protein [Candidatus Berkelbacteria bacterium]
MNEIINYTRLTTSDRLSDRFLTCQAYNPVDPEQAELGTVFSHVEILNPWFPTSQIGQTVINTLIREYYRGKNTSELVNFEEAIKKVNEALAQTAQNGDTDWIGKFSSVLVMQNKGEIHFAQTGQSHAYLYRNGKINHITEGLEQEEAPHPLKTFSNLTSGTLQVGDKVIIANSAFYEIIHPAELKTIITSFNSTLAAIETAKILQEHNAQEANAIFLEYTTKDELANCPPDQKLEAIYIDQQLQGIGTATKKIFKKTFEAIGRISKSSASAISKTSKSHLLPLAKKGWQASRKGSRKAFSTTAELAKKKFNKISEKNHTENIENFDNHQNDKQEKEKNDGLLFAKTFLLRIKNKIRRFLISIGFYSKKKSKMYLSALIIILIVLGISLFFGLRQKSKNDVVKTAQSQMTQITSLEGQAAVLTSQKKDSAALSEYKNIIELASKLNGTKYQDEASKASSQAQLKISEITKMTFLEPKSKISVSDEQSSFALANNDLFQIIQSGKVFEKKSNASNLNLFSDSGKIPSKIISSTYISESNSFALSLENKTVQTINLDNKKISTEEVKLNYAGMISAFSGNIYLLDPPGNQIWKIAPENSQYKTNAPYIKDQTIDISSTQSMAIDGSIYVLKANGSVEKISRGSKTNEFGVSLPADEKLSDYIQIFTSEKSDYLFLVVKDAGQIRIIELKKNGTFVKQYFLNESSNFQNTLVNPDTLEFYVKTQKEILVYQP